MKKSPAKSALNSRIVQVPGTTICTDPKMVTPGASRLDKRGDPTPPDEEKPQ